MRSLSRQLFKNYQINLGMPFQVKVPANEVFAGRFSDQAEYLGEDFDRLMEESGETDGLYADDGQEVPEPVVSPGELAEEAAKQILDEAGEQAKTILEEASREAEDILEKAAQEAEEGRIQAERTCSETCAKIEADAEKRGYKNGCDKGRGEYEQIISEADQIRISAHEDYNELMSGAEADVVALSLEIAKKVIGEEMILNRQNLLVLVKDAIDHCSNKQQIVLKVSPDDYDYIRANKDILLSIVEGIGKFEIRKEHSLKEGSCFVETLYGNVDAGISTKLSKVEDAFHRLLNAHGGRVE